MRRHFNYSKDLQQKVVADYLLQGMSQKEVAARHGIRCRSLVSKWVHAAESQEKSVSLQPETQTPSFMDKYDNMDADALRQRLRELESDLHHAKLQNLALNTLIDIAEQQGIRIRKKSGAKQ